MKGLCERTSCYSKDQCIDAKVLLFHLTNHYALVFAWREWQDEDQAPALKRIESKFWGCKLLQVAVSLPLQGKVHLRRQILTARRGQRPSAWIDFHDVRRTLQGSQTIETEWSQVHCSMERRAKELMPWRQLTTCDAHFDQGLDGLGITCSLCSVSVQNQRKSSAVQPQQKMAIRMPRVCKPACKMIKKMRARHKGLQLAHTSSPS